MKNKKLLSLFLLFFFLFMTPLSTFASYPIINASASILVDEVSGSVLYQDNIDEQRPMASISKLMSIYIFLDEMSEKEIKLEDKYKISERVGQLKSQSSDISGVWFTEGEVITVEKLLELSFVYSDNSAMIQLAEIASGSESAHVDKINEQARAWNLPNTVFVNVTGLNMIDYGVLQLPGIGENEYNKSSARELASMIKKILEKYPEVINYTSKSSIEFRGETLNSFNMMLPGLDEEYPGVTGLKTGTSDEAGYSFAGYYTYNGKNYISIILGAKSTNARFEETKKMYNWIQGQSINVVVDKALSFKFNLKGDVAFNINLTPKNEILSIGGNGFNSTVSSITYNKEYFDENDRVIKNIPAGEIVATITLKNLKEQEVTTVDGTSDSFNLDLVSDSEINAQGKILSFFGSALSYFESLYNSIIKI